MFYWSGMRTSNRPHESNQEMLLPAAPQDGLPQGHLTYFISDTVGVLNLKSYRRRSNIARMAVFGLRQQPWLGWFTSGRRLDTISHTGINQGSSLAE